MLRFLFFARDDWIISMSNPAPHSPNPSSPRLTPMKCSTCGEPFFLQQSPSPPFCSVRCQQVDLGRWLDESIGVPFEGDSGDVPVEYRDEPPPSPLVRLFHDEDDEDDERG